MIGGNLEIFADQGCTFSYNISIIDLLNNSGYDLSTGIISGYLKKSYYTDNISAQFIVTIIDADSGIINIELDSETTKNLTPTRYVFDLLIDYGNNIKYPLLKGIFYLSPSATI